MMAVYLIIAFALFVVVAVYGLMKFNALDPRQNKRIDPDNMLVKFNEIYKELYDKHIYKLEEMRKKTRLRVIAISNATVAVIAIISILPNVFSLPANYQGVCAIILIVYFILSYVFLIIAMVASKGYSKTYAKEYKDKIVAEFIKLLNDNLVYNPEPIGTCCYREYGLSEFTKESYNRYNPDDYIEGYLNKEVFVKMCDLHVFKHTGSGKNEYIKQMFRGMFAFVPCRKDINIRVDITSSSIVKADNRVEMDSKDFEKYFDVYSENKIIAMQLLTSDIMELLIDFYERHNIKFEVAIKNDMLYMRFFTGAMFEPKVLGNSMDKVLLFTYFCILKLISDVTREVNKTIEELEI